MNNKHFFPSSRSSATPYTNCDTLMQNHFNGVTAAATTVTDPEKDPEPDWIVKKQRFSDIYKNLNGGVKNVEKCDENLHHKSNDEDKMENVNAIHENHDELIMKSNNNNTKVLNNNNNEAINLSVSPKSASTCVSDDDNNEELLNGHISEDSSDNHNKISHKSENSPSTALMYKLNHAKKHTSSKRVKEIELDDDCDMKNDIINTNNSYKSHKISYISQKDNVNNINNDHIVNKGSSDDNSLTTTRHVNSCEDSVIDNHEQQYSQHNNIINNNHHSSSKKGKFCMLFFRFFCILLY